MTREGGLAGAVWSGRHLAIPTATGSTREASSAVALCGQGQTKGDNGGRCDVWDQVEGGPVCVGCGEGTGGLARGTRGAGVPVLGSGARHWDSTSLAPASTSAQGSGTGVRGASLPAAKGGEGKRHLTRQRAEAGGGPEGLAPARTLGPLSLRDDAGDSSGARRAAECGRGGR